LPVHIEWCRGSKSHMYLRMIQLYIMISQFNSVTSLDGFCCSLLFISLLLRYVLPDHLAFLVTANESDTDLLVHRCIYHHALESICTGPIRTIRLIRTLDTGCSIQLCLLFIKHCLAWDANTYLVPRARSRNE